MTSRLELGRAEGQRPRSDDAVFVRLSLPAAALATHIYIALAFLRPPRPPAQALNSLGSWVATAPFNVLR